jgi:hypothetical protein
MTCVYIIHLILGGIFGPALDLHRPAKNTPSPCSTFWYTDALHNAMGNDPLALVDRERVLRTSFLAGSSYELSAEVNNL